MDRLESDLYEDPAIEEKENRVAGAPTTVCLTYDAGTRCVSHGGGPPDHFIDSGL